MNVCCETCKKDFLPEDLYELPNGSLCCAICLNHRLIDAEMLKPFIDLGNYIRSF